MKAKAGLRSASAPALVPPAGCETILNSISEGLFSVDHEWRITSFNKAAERITGISRDDAVGKPCHEVLRADICSDACALSYTLRTGLPVTNFAARLTNRAGEQIPVSISTAILRDGGGKLSGAVEMFRDLSQVEALRRALDDRFRRHEILTRSPLLEDLLDLLPFIAASDSTVLIEGESGTGKELVARALHALGPRRVRPLVTVNRAAIPESLIESELFGYRAGAFTGATRDSTGRLRAAHGGTLFLDEVGEMSPSLQAKLLRVIEDRRFEPIGDTHTVTIDVRFVAATHHDLVRDVAAGTFRDDLFFRLNVVHIKLPPLRQRREDIPLLVGHFLAHLTTTRGREVTSVSPEAFAALQGYDFPGNVRELQNAIEHAFVMSAGGVIDVRHLPESIRGASQSPSTSLGSDTAHFEAGLIETALQRHGFHRSAAARALGIRRTTLRKKIRRYGIALPSSDGRTRRKDSAS